MNRTLVLAVAIGALLGAAAMWLLGAAAPAALPGGERARVERTVRDYLLANPEIIPEALQRLQDRETGKQIAADRSAITRPFAGAVAGNPRGDVTVVEFYDYNCGYCRASLPTLRRLIADDPKVRVVFRELPILSEESRTAARLSLAAAEQGRFVLFHDALYAGGRVTEASMARAAQQAGVDRAKAAANRARYDAEIVANIRTAQRLGMTGTPSWVIGDRVLSGAVDLAELKKAVAAAR